jgi:hypothetical protein
LGAVHCSRASAFDSGRESGDECIADALPTTWFNHMHSDARSYEWLLAENSGCDRRANGQLMSAIDRNETYRDVFHVRQ